LPNPAAVTFADLNLCVVNVRQHLAGVAHVGKRVQRNGSRFSVGLHAEPASRTATGRSPAPALQIHAILRRLMRLVPAHRDDLTI
jgi:hypothetical protein